MKYEEELKYLQQQLRYFKEQAELDLLTKLYNRMSFEKYVNAELEKNRGGCFLVLDMNNFKKINDNYGHLAGDKVLKEIGLILKKAFPNPAFAGRVGGDEFAVYIPEKCVGGKGKKIAVEEKIKSVAEKMAEIIKAVGGDFTVECAVGILEIIEKENFSTAYEKGDTAMYRAKKLKQIFCWYVHEK